LYKAVEELGSRNRFANELVAYHMMVNIRLFLVSITNFCIWGSWYKSPMEERNSQEFVKPQT